MYDAAAGAEAVLKGIGQTFLLDSTVSGVVVLPARSKKRNTKSSPEPMLARLFSLAPLLQRALRKRTGCT